MVIQDDVSYGVIVRIQRVGVLLKRGTENGTERKTESNGKIYKYLCSVHIYTIYSQWYYIIIQMSKQNSNQIKCACLVIYRFIIVMEYLYCALNHGRA